MDSTYAKKILSYYIASNIHENWRLGRVVSTGKGSSKHNPSWETTNDIKFIYNIIKKKRIDAPYKNAVIISEDNVLIDSANLEFIALPYDTRNKVITIATDCLDLVFDKVISSQLITNSELEDLAMSLYMKYGFNKETQQENSILSQTEQDNMQKQEYKAMLNICKEAVESYKKGNINLIDIEKNFGIEKESTTDLNLMDATKFLKIDSVPLKPLVYLKYTQSKGEDLYWNTDEFTSVISYLNSNNIKNAWFIENYPKFINKIKGENLTELLQRLKFNIEKYENKPKWLVKVEKDNIFTKWFRKMKSKFLDKKIQKELQQYEEEKVLFRFLTDYIKYITSIDEIKIRYSDYNRNGICKVKTNQENKNDKLYIYSDGSIVYVPSDFWNKPQFLCNINIGKDVTENMVKFLSNESCHSIANVVMSCSMRLKEKPVFSKTITLKKLLSLSNTIAYAENT